MIDLNISWFGSENIEKANQEILHAHKALKSLVAKECSGYEFTGWFDWPEQRGFALAEDITSYCENLDVAYDTVVVVGIGGSYLGTRAVCDALKHDFSVVTSSLGQPKAQIFYAGHNLSEIGLIELLEVLEKCQPIVNVISKSGTTTEPSVAFRILRNYMEKRYGQDGANRRIVATTDGQRGALRKLADEAGWKTFEVPDDVGGRYSVLTAVGLLPLSLAGFSISELLSGADKVFEELKACSQKEGSSHPVLSYAACRKVAWDSGKRIEILAYGEPKFASLVEWWKQLFGESEGKSGFGMFPSGLSCTTDLHSLGQYLQDGPRNLLETFLYVQDEVSRDSRHIERRLQIPVLGRDDDGLGYIERRYLSEVNQAAMEATKIAHFEGGVPCLQLSMPRRDEQSLGALIAFFETACAVSGSLLGVNPFDQPGVEAYKTNLFGLMGKPGYEKLGEEIRKKL
jgi:glucose-6-phosphate isomerase